MVSAMRASDAHRGRATARERTGELTTISLDDRHWACQRLHDPRAASDAGRAILFDSSMAAGGTVAALVGASQVWMLPGHNLKNEPSVGT